LSTQTGERDTSHGVSRAAPRAHAHHTLQVAHATRVCVCVDGCWGLDPRSHARAALENWPASHHPAFPPPRLSPARRAATRRSHRPRHGVASTPLRTPDVRQRMRQTPRRAPSPSAAAHPPPQHAPPQIRGRERSAAATRSGASARKLAARGRVHTRHNAVVVHHARLVVTRRPLRRRRRRQRLAHPGVRSSYRGGHRRRSQALDELNLSLHDA